MEKLSKEKAIRGFIIMAERSSYYFLPYIRHYDKNFTNTISNSHVNHEI